MLRGPCPMGAGEGGLCGEARVGALFLSNTCHLEGIRKASPVHSVVR